MTKEFSLIDVGVAVVVVGLLCFALGITIGTPKARAEAYTAGKIEGFKEAQSADLVADRCVAFWFGSEREGAKTMQRFCNKGEQK